MIPLYHIFLFVTLVFMLKSCSPAHDKPLTEDNERFSSVEYVRVAPVQQSSSSTLEEAIGILMPNADYKPSFKTGGVVNKAYVKEGDTVRKGQKLASLDLEEINAQVSKANVGYQKAERDFERVQNLFRDSVATYEQFQNAQTALDLANQSMRIAKFNQRLSEVSSPINGKIIQQLVQEGDIIGPGQPIYVLMGVEKNNWKIKVGLTERTWAKVKLNQEVDVQFTAYPEHTYKGKVAYKNIAGTSDNGTFDIEVALITAPSDLALGMTATIHFVLENTSSTMKIPIASLVRAQNGIGEVFIHKKGVAIKKKIKLLDILGDSISVGSGLTTEDEVVTIGAMYLSDGDKIKIE